MLIPPGVTVAQGQLLALVRSTFNPGAGGFSDTPPQVILLTSTFRNTLDNLSYLCLSLGKAA